MSNTTNGAVDMHAVVTGNQDGPAVVLSNSLASTHHMSDAQLTALKQHFRVIRYDTRGHGLSPVPQGSYTIDDLADDLVALLDRLDIAREKAYSQELQKAGKWPHIWRIVGEYSNYSIFDVESNEELHTIISGLPLWPAAVISDGGPS